MGATSRGDFGQRLRDFRRRAALSQEELAERANLTAKAVSALERGERDARTPSTVRALCDALDLDEADRSVMMSSVPQSSARTAARGIASHLSSSMNPATSLDGWHAEVGP